MFLLAFAEGTSVQLVPDGTILIHIALVLLMIFILNRTFFRPINRIIDVREKKRGGRHGESATILKEIAEKQNKYNETMREARSKGYEIVEQERSAALGQKQAIVGEAREEAERTFAAESAQLERQTAEARAAIAAEAEKIADRISANILKSA